MKKQKKVFMVVLGFLALILFAFPMTASAATLHVGSGQTYPTISSAITAANNGDTIIVHDGTYTENVDVTKQLIIQSVNGYSSTTVVASSSSDHVFEVTADNVTIEGFSIYGATGSSQAGIYLSSGRTGCTIENNRCGWDAGHNNYYGIYLDLSSNNTISGNTASHNDYGIFLYSSSNNNTVSSNICNSNNDYGIYLYSSSHNTVSSNTCNSNSSRGIYLYSSSTNTVSGNTCNSNSYFGIYLYSSSGNTVSGNTCNPNNYEGIFLYYSSNNTVSGNTCSSNGDCGIYLHSSSNNTVSGNTCSSNNIDGIYLCESSGNAISDNTCNLNTHYGIFLVSSSNNSVSDNTCSSNGDCGIYLHSSSNNTLTDNTANENDYGIFLVSSRNNTVSSNTCSSNTQSGIYLSSSSSNNTVSGNTASNNREGIELSSSSNTLTGNTANENDYGICLYASSNNTVSGNTCNSNSYYGIFVSSSSNNNTVSGNTANLNYHGILLSSSSNNTLTNNTANSNNSYGIYLYSSSNNTLYLNNLSNNTTANAYVSGGSGNIWNSPTTICYDYPSGLFHKNYLGNYYDDYTGSDGEGDGIGDTGYSGTGMTDYYPLMATSDNYSLQAWWLHSDSIMYRDDRTKSPGSVTLSASSSQIWKADQAALMNISFSGDDTWTGQIVFTSAPASGHTFTVEMGSSTDGTDFTAGGPDATITGNGTDSVFTYETDASAFTVVAGEYLALKITNNSGSEYDVQTGGGWSYCSSPELDWLSGFIAGTVTDANTTNPLEGVFVTAQSANGPEWADTTDAAGYYEMEVASGLYTVTFEKEGYNPGIVEDVEVIEGQTTVVDYAMEFAIMDVQPRTVEATIPANVEQIEIGTLTVSNSGSGDLHWSGEVVFDDIACAVDLSDSLLVIFGQELTYVPISWLSYAGDFGPDEVPLLYIVNTETGALQSVDIETGNVISTIGYPDVEGLTVTGMAYDKSSPEGGMYLSASNGSQSKIYSLDLETGAATEIGMVTGVPSLIDIAIDGEGQMYGYCTETDASYSIDKTTGAATLLGQIGFDASYNQGMSWAPEEDIIYLVAYDATAGGQLRVLDTNTGATTLVEPLPNAAEYDVLAFYSGEPARIMIEPEEGVVSAGESTEVTIYANSVDVPAGADLVADLFFYNEYNPDNTILVDVTVHVEPEGVDSQEQVSEFTRLEPNFPNPFSHSTTFKFALKHRGHVELAVYNIRGQRVATVVDEEKEPGWYEIPWTPTDGHHELANGIYFYRLKAGNKTFVKKMMIMR